MTIEIHEMDNIYYIIEVDILDDRSSKVIEYFIAKDDPQFFRFINKVHIKNSNNTDILAIIILYKRGLYVLATLLDKVFDSNENIKRIYKDLYSDLE